MAQFEFTGIVAAPFLPMLPDQSIDWLSLRSYIGWIAAGQPTAIAMNMDASEGPALDRDEQLAVLRECRNVVGAACPLLSGLISASTRDAVRWGRELKAAGAEGLAVFPPFPTLVMGCDGALIGFAGTATRDLIDMHRAVVAKDFARAFAIWDRLGPLARYCWRAPIRDYRPRMKEVLKLQGLIAHATARAPQLGVDDAERAELRRLAQVAGLLDVPTLRAAGN